MCETDACFATWFAASKVVDATGSPLVVFHGTPHDFESFDTDRYNEIGSHFGTADQADRILDYWRAKNKIRGLHIKPVFLSLHNPLRLDDVGSFRVHALKPQLMDLGILTGDPAQWTGPEAMQAVKRAIEKAGHDGVVYANTREGDGDSWIAFRPEQIRSSIGIDLGLRRADLPERIQAACAAREHLATIDPGHKRALPSM